MPLGVFFFFFQAEDGIRDVAVTGVQTCALPIYCKEGEFPGERHEALQDEMELGKLGFSFHNVVCGAQDPLPLAVIAHPASLEHGGKAKLPDGGVKFAGFRNGEEIGGCDAEISEEGFLSERSEEHTSELQSRLHTVCRLLL